MWTSNAATAMMLMPIGLSVYGMIREAQGAAKAAGFGAALLVAIAYGANVGGMGSLIGTPPKTILKGYMESAHGIEIGFAQWLWMGLPPAWDPSADHTWTAALWRWSLLKQGICHLPQATERLFLSIAPSP